MRFTLLFCYSSSLNFKSMAERLITNYDPSVLLVSVTVKSITESSITNYKVACICKIGKKCDTGLLFPCQLKVTIRTLHQDMHTWQHFNLTNSIKPSWILGIKVLPLNKDTFKLAT